MGGNYGQSKSSSSSSNVPWASQQPYLENLFKRAENLYQQGPYQFYPGQTVAPESAVSQQALSAIANRGLGGSPNLGSATNLNQATTGGYFLGGPGSNPYLDPTYNRMAQLIGENYNRVVAPDITSRFSAAGRLGSGAYQNAVTASQEQLGQNLSSAATQLYGQNYDAERNRMEAAAAQAPALAAAGYTDLGQAQQAGAAQEAYQQKLIDEAVQRYQYGQEAPAQQLAQYSNFLGQPIMTSFGNSGSSAFNVGVSSGKKGS